MVYLFHKLKSLRIAKTKNIFYNQKENIKYTQKEKGGKENETNKRK